MQTLGPTPWLNAHLAIPLARFGWQRGESLCAVAKYRIPLAPGSVRAARPLASGEPPSSATGFVPTLMRAVRPLAAGAPPRRVAGLVPSPCHRTFAPSAERLATRASGGAGCAAIYLRPSGRSCITEARFWIRASLSAAPAPPLGATKLTLAVWAPILASRRSNICPKQCEHGHGSRCSWPLI